MSAYGWKCKDCGESQSGYMLSKWAGAALFDHREHCDAAIKAKQEAVRTYSGPLRSAQ